MIGLSEALYWTCYAVSALVQPIFVLKCWAIFRDWGGPRFVRNGARRLVVWARRARKSAPDAPASPEESDVDEFVQKLKDSRRVGMARAMINIMWGAICLMWWMRVIEVIVAPTVAAQDDLWDSRITWLATLLMLTGGAVFPNTLVTLRLLPVWLITLTAGLCFATLTAAAPGLPQGRLEIEKDKLEVFLAYWPYMIIWTVTLACVCLKFKVLVVCSLCTSTCYCAVLLSLDTSCGAKTTTKSGLFVDSLSLWLWQVGLFYGMEKVLEFSVKKEVEAALGKCQGSAVSALLDLICDAVVDLDSDLALKSHCRKLAGLLLVREGKSLRGAKFAEFIAPSDDDKVNFHNALPGAAQLGEGGEMAEALVPNMATVRLRDAAGNPFGAVMYHLPYRSVNGRLHHLIGLQEASDDAGHRLQGVHNQRPLPPAVLNNCVADALQGAAAASSSGSGRCETGDESRGSDSGSSRSSGGSSGGGHAVRWSGALVVLAHESLKVVASDEVVKEKLGLDIGARFADVLGSRRGKFVRRIMEDAEKVQRGELRPHTWDAGVREISVREESDGAVRWLPCQVVAEFRDDNIPNNTIVKLHLTLEPGRKGDWRTRMGPLRSSRHGAAAKALRISAHAPSEPQVVVLRL